MSEQAAENTETPETPAPVAEEQAQEANTNEDTPQEERSESDWDPERAKEKIRKINSENRALRERAASAEKKASTAEELQTQNQTLGSENLRLRVGYELGLPLNLAVRLQGNTREELVADAEQLVALISPTTKPAPPSSRPIEQLRPGATPTDQQPVEQDNYPADFLPRRMRERLAAPSS
jgi:hypothetical protein